MSVWDDPELKSNDNYVRWENPGDSVAGEILAITVHTFLDGKKAPKLILRTDDGEEITITAGQVLLQRALVEQRPEVGDRIGIRFDNVEKREGGRTLKHFTVQVKKNETAPVGAAADSII